MAFNPPITESWHLQNLYAHQISTTGQVPVDGSAPNVHVKGDRRGVFYDSTPEQILWARWANGEFGADDELTATTAKWYRTNRSQRAGNHLEEILAATLRLS
jgi:hypothetical protein